MTILKKILHGLFKDDIETKDSEIQSLKDSLSDEKQVSSEKDSQIHLLEAASYSLRQGVENLTRSINSLEEEAGVLRLELKNAQDYNTSFKKEIRSLKGQIEFYKENALREARRAEELLGALAPLRMELGDARRKLSTMQREYNSIVANFNNFKLRSEEDMEGSRSELQAVSEQLDAVKSEKDQLQILIGEYLQKISGLEEMYALESESHERALPSLRSQVEDRNHEIDTKEDEIENLRIQLDTRDDELSDLRDKKDSEISDLSESLRMCQDSLQSKTEECETLRKQLVEDNQKNQVDTELLESLREDISSKQDEIINLELTIQKLHETISDIRKAKDSIDTKLKEKEEECAQLQSTLKEISDKNSHIFETERSLFTAQQKIDELEQKILSMPSEDDLIKREKEIARLSRIISELKSQIDATKEVSPKQDDISDEEEVSSSSTSVKRPTTKESKRIFRKFKYPYITKPIPFTGGILRTKDFPKIENDNIDGTSIRSIDEVLDYRTNKIISANSIFLKWTAEKISTLSSELVEAVRTNQPYLICPCCRQMLKISGRTVGFGDNCRGIQFFTHAVRNIPCDLKRDYSYEIPIDGTGIDPITDYLKIIRNLLREALISDICVAKGISKVEESSWISSDELPIMKRRLSHVTAVYNSRRIAFEFVTPTTTLSKVRDRDIFYRINNYHVFWLFGLNSMVDYNELLRSVAKDIMFTNKRNIFVFDIEAQQESQRLGELILKCNWLDEDNEWYYRLEKDGKNGILVSIDKIKFDDDSCRPYYFDADEPYFLNYPSGERPAKISREELKKNLTEAWNYKISRDNAIKEMYRNGDGVEAFFDGEKWGFKYDSLVFIEPIFDKEPEIFGAYAKVCFDRKYGAVSRFGEIALRAAYDAVEILPNNRLLYSDGKDWHIFGIIDPLISFSQNDEIKKDIFSETDGIYRLIINRNLYEGQNPEEFIFFGEMIFKRDRSLEKWILWYSIGENVMDKTWDNIEITSGNQLKLYDGKKTILLFQDGTVNQEVIIEGTEYLEKLSLRNGYHIIKDMDGYWGILDDKNDYAVIPLYDCIEQINDNYLKFLSDGKWGIMSITGDKLIDPEYSSIESFNDGVFSVTIPNPDKTWEKLTGIIDLQGKRISEKVYDLSNTLRITKLFERLGIESDNEIIIDHIYEEIRRWSGNKYQAKKNGHWGIIDITNGITLLPFKHSKISALVKNKAAVRVGSKTFYINSDCQIIEDTVISLQDGYKKIKREGKWGIIGPDGSELVAPKYDEITTFRGQLIGIINGSIIKLGAVYPYKLQMSGINIRVEGKDMVQVSTILFQLTSKRQIASIDATASIVLTNWTYSMKYPTAITATERNLKKKTKHIDLPEDFYVGETVEGKIIKIKKKNKRIKSIDVLTSSGKETHVYAPDFKYSGIFSGDIEIGKTICLTKKSYNDDLDRTLWHIDKL